MTDTARLLALMEAATKPVAHRYPAGGYLKLYGHGSYLSVRPDISMNVEHIDELGQPRIDKPFQAVPFYDAVHTALIAEAVNALPGLLDTVQCSVEVIKQLQAENERLRAVIEIMCVAGLVEREKIDQAERIYRKTKEALNEKG